MPTLRQKYVNIYWCWKAIKQRTLNPKCRAYKNYGARGIGVCDEWLEFEPFCEWALKTGWEKGLDLDRINNDGDYSPDNCRWITRRENVNNRRKTTKITVDGVTKPESVWNEELGLSYGTVNHWVRNHGLEYAASRIKDVLSNGYIAKDYGYSHRKEIVHIESGKRFQSTKEAAEHFGIASCTISNAIRRNGSTRKGTFRYV